MDSLPHVEKKGILVLHKSGRELSATNSKQPPVLLMLSGFPDTAETWKGFASHFESDYHVVAMAYPGFEEEKLSNTWGYGFDEVVSSLLVVVQAYRDLGCSQVYLVAHDWGAMPVLLYTKQYPSTLTKLVLEDVGIIDVYEHNLKDHLLLLVYNIYLSALFLISRIVPGTWWFDILYHWYPWKWVGPIYEETPKASPHHCYPCLRNLVHFAASGGKEIGLPFPEGVPTIFVYGKWKRCMFHSPSFLTRLDQTKGCKHIGYEDAGHWIHTTHQKQLATDVQDFFEEPL